MYISLSAARFVAPALMAFVCLAEPCAAADGMHLAGTSQDSVAYQINPAHTGNITFSGGFSAPLKQLWSVNMGGGVSYPVTANGMVFVTVGLNGSALLEALNSATGAVQWEKLISGSGSWADAAYDNGDVFVINSSGTLTAFRAATGKLRWSAQLPGQQNNYYADFSAPVARNGLVVVQYQSQNYSQTIVAFDEKTGVAKWTLSPGANGVGGTSGAAAIGDNGIYLGSSTTFYDLSPADGSTVWSANSSCSPSDVPVLTNTSVYVLGNYNCSTGNAIYNATNGSLTGYFAGATGPTILDRKYMVVSLSGALYCYSPKNDNVKWTFSPGNNNGFLKPIVINGFVAALSTNGYLYVLDGATGQEYWTTSLGYNYNNGGPDTGLGAGEGALLVPYGGYLTAFVPQNAAK